MALTYIIEAKEVPSPVLTKTTIRYSGEETETSGPVRIIMQNFKRVGPAAPPARVQ